MKRNVWKWKENQAESILKFPHLWCGENTNFGGIAKLFLSILSIY